MMAGGRGKALGTSTELIPAEISGTNGLGRFRALPANPAHCSSSQGSWAGQQAQPRICWSTQQSGSKHGVAPGECFTPGYQGGGALAQPGIPSLPTPCTDAGTTLLPHTHPSEGAWLQLLPLLLVTATVLWGKSSLKVKGVSRDKGSFSQKGYFVNLLVPKNRENH